MRAIAVSLAFALALLSLSPAAPAQDDGKAARADILSILDELGLSPDRDTESPARLAATAGPETIGECCKTCRKGKACGDSCIDRTETCEQPPGCACDWE
jgi:hypothetical protein